MALRTVLGTAYYGVWMYLVARWVSPAFSMLYIFYPFLEQSLMLSGINWSWHAFIDPNDVENEYVQSITLLGGTINVLNEDSHVVHHQYPGMLALSLTRTPTTPMACTLVPRHALHEPRQARLTRHASHSCLRG